MSRGFAWSIIAIIAASGLAGWLLYGPVARQSELGVFLLVGAVLLLFLSLGLAAEGGPGKAEPAGPKRKAKTTETAGDALPGDVAGIRVVVSERGMSVPFQAGWRDFAGYPESVIDPDFPAGALELELVEPAHASFGVIGQRGVVFRDDGSLRLDIDGVATEFDDLAALFASPQRSDLGRERSAGLFLELFGHVYAIDPSGGLVPAADGSGDRRGRLVDILTAATHSGDRARFESRMSPGRVFGVIGGRPVRVGEDGTVEWIRSDGVVIFPSLLAARTAISAS